MESRMASAVLLCLLLTCLPRGRGFRLLPTESPGTVPGVKAATFSLKAATYFNKFYRGPTVLSVEVVGSAEICSNLCTSDGRCEVWTWCPLNITQGCEVLNFGDLATTTTTTTITTTGIMAYGTCILSCSLRPGAKEFIFMAGERVEWSGGISNATTIPPSPLPSPSPVEPLPSPQPADSPAPAPAPAPEAPSPQPSPEPEAPSPQPSPAPEVPSPQPVPESPRPADSPSPAPASPAPEPFPSPPPSPVECSTKDGCPCHPPPSFALPEGHNTINWPIGITLGGSNPECYDVKSGDFVRSPSTYSTCKKPNGDPTDTVYALAQSFCNSTADAANLAFAAAVQQGGQAATDAVAALLLAQTDLACFQGSTILSVMSPPLSVVQDHSFPQTVSNILSYFSRVADAGERAGMGLCVVVYSTQGDVADVEAAAVLATIHTGTPQ